jgi:DNA-binding response OmpR family regulator
MRAHRQDTVLVVEDEALIRLAVRHYLEKGGFRVLEAANREEALSCIDERKVDLLLTDVVLSGDDGSQLAREITARQPNVRVLFMSAHPPEALRSMHRVDADSPTLQKPFTEVELIRRVRDLLI